MSALSIKSSTPSERQLTGRVLFLLAGLAALGALATNIILPAFPRIGASLGVCSRELGLTLSSFLHCLRVPARAPDALMVDVLRSDTPCFSHSNPAQRKQ